MPVVATAVNWQGFADGPQTHVDHLPGSANAREAASSCPSGRFSGQMDTGEATAGWAAIIRRGGLLDAAGHESAGGESASLARARRRRRAPLQGRTPWRSDERRPKAGCLQRPGLARA